MDNDTFHESMVEKVNAALDQVRPYLQADGGDISLVEITPEKIVRVQLLGACGICDISSHTIKVGVETTIRRYIPEIVAVEAV